MCWCWVVVAVGAPWVLMTGLPVVALAVGLEHLIF
jgi:hypothetical protein